MLIFEFTNGSIINLLSLESAMVDNGHYYVYTTSGRKYEVTLDEINAIKNILKDELKDF